MTYSQQVQNMCPITKGPKHGPAPIPEEGAWVKAYEIKDISGYTHGVGWCAPQQGTCKLSLNIKNGVIEEALVETIGCSGMTHSAAMAGEILPGKTILEALNTDLVCDAINVAMRELFLQIVYGRSQTAFSEDGLPIGAGLDDLGKGLRSMTGTIFSTKAKGVRYLELTEGYINKLALDANDEVIGYQFVKLGKMMDYAILDELAEQHRKRDEIPELTAYCDALHWMRPGRQYLCNVYNTVCHAFHLLRRNPVRDNRLLVTEKELRHAERMLPELGRQTFTEMVRLKGYMVYDAEQLADKCGMEYGSFRRKVKKMTGYTAKEWVIKERAKDVEHYLKNTNLTLTEVAFTTGFASTSNLNDFCKAYLLDTPGEIRRKAQETRKCTVTRT